MSAPCRLRRLKVGAVAFNEFQGRPIIVSGGLDRALVVWDLRNDEPLSRLLIGHDGSVNAVAVDMLNAQPVVVSGGLDRTEPLECGI
jgi:WD40 repeat protein